MVVWWRLTPWIWNARQSFVAATSAASAKLDVEIRHLRAVILEVAAGRVHQGKMLTSLLVWMIDHLGCTRLDREVWIVEEQSATRVAAAVVAVNRSGLESVMAEPGQIELMVEGGEKRDVLVVPRDKLGELLELSDGETISFAVPLAEFASTGPSLSDGQADVEAHGFRGVVASSAITASLIVGAVGAHDALADHHAPARTHAPCSLTCPMPTRGPQAQGHLRFIPYITVTRATENGESI